MKPPTPKQIELLTHPCQHPGCKATARHKVKVNRKTVYACDQHYAWASIGHLMRHLSR